MANWRSVAGLAVDIAGAVLLAKSLASGGAPSFVRQHPIRAHPGTVDAGADLQRARDQSEARLGVGLLIVGFSGQLVGGLSDAWSSTAGLIAGALAVAWIAAALLVRPRYIRRWESRIFVARARSEYERRIGSRGQEGADQGVARTVIDYWQELELLGRVRLPDTGNFNFTAKLEELIGHLCIGQEDPRWLVEAAARMRAAGSVD